MFTRIQTNAYKSLLSVDQRLGSFCSLVGPNASGKSSFLDCIGLLSDLMQSRGDVRTIMQARSPDFRDLLWLGQGKSFQIAVETTIPERVRSKLSDEKFRTEHARLRYELEIGLDDEEVLGINSETLWLTAQDLCGADDQSPDLFPDMQFASGSILLKTGSTRKASLRKKGNGNDNYYPEGRKTYNPVFKLGRQKSALANLPADVDSFPASVWFLDYLQSRVQPFILNSQKIRMPSPPGQSKQFSSDGANLPWVIRALKEKDDKRCAQWLRHIRTALPDINEISTVVREEDRHCYLRVHYTNGAVVPSWLVSDGTLRLLALTIPAYLADFEGTFLIEEPENGVHPSALETVLQSLMSIYSGQVLMATHSPIVLNMVEPEKILCFAKDANGATAIVSGENHPALRAWKKGSPDLGALFASGILG